MYPGNQTGTNCTRRQKTSQSCENCHRRKVRCDVNISGSPCTNCQLDKRQCERRVPLKRGRKSFLDRDTRRNPPPAPGSRHEHMSRRQAVERSQEDVSKTPILLPADLSDSVTGEKASPIGIPSETHVFVPFYYHSYLKRVDISHLAPIQVQVLEEQGCLKVPSGSVLHEFVRQYFLYVHPCLPILNEASFWSLFQGQMVDQSNNRGISLALFQAMLFAASRFVPPQLIEACGFDSLMDARTSFHRRSELLLLNGVEKDPILLAQTSLLLSLQSTINDQSLNSAWLTKAINYAKQADAQPDTESVLEKKKLWWSCILRDRMIAIGVRRNVQCMLTESDLDQIKLTEDDLAEQYDQSQVYSPATKKMLSRIIIAQCELAVAQTPTITSAYGQTETLENHSIAQLVAAITGVERAKTELSIWSRRFKTTLLKSDDSSQQDNATNASFTLFADMTLIHYYSTLVALSNHEISVLKRHQVHLDDYSSRLDVAIRQLTSSIANVADRVKQLNDQGLAHHLPISAPACTALPFVLEALNLRLSTAAQKPNHQKQLDYYTKIMKTFRTQHDHTECVTTAVDNILRVVEPEISQMSTVTEASPHNTITTLARPSSWSDILSKDPMFYLRLCLFLDLALSQGKAPRVSNLPTWTLGVDAGLQTPLSSSLHFIPPLMPQAIIPDAEQSRFVELNDDTDTDTGVAEIAEQWPAFSYNNGIMDHQTPWPFIDIDMRAWFNLI